MSSLPPELDFTRNAEATPARMDEAMTYLLARIRAVEAIQPEFASVIEELRRVGLQKIADGIVPVYDQAFAVRDALQSIREIWEADLLPAEIVAAASAAVLGLVYDKDQADGRYPLKGDVYSKGVADARYPAVATVYTKEQVDALVMLRALAAGVYTMEVSDARYPAMADFTAAVARLVPANGTLDQVLRRTGSGPTDYAWAGLPTTSWSAIGTIAMTATASVTFSAIPVTYNDLLVVIDDLKCASAGNGIRLAPSADGVTFSAGTLFGAGTSMAATTRYSGSIFIPAYRNGAAQAAVGVWNNANAAESPTIAPFPVGGFAIRCTGGVSALRLLPDTGAFSASGVAKLYAR